MRNNTPRYHCPNCGTELLPTRLIEGLDGDDDGCRECNETFTEEEADIEWHDDIHRDSDGLTPEEAITEVTEENRVLQLFFDGSHAAHRVVDISDRQREDPIFVEYFAKNNRAYGQTMNEIRDALERADFYKTASRNGFYFEEVDG